VSSPARAGLGSNDEDEVKVKQEEDEDEETAKKVFEGDLFSEPVKVELKTAFFSEAGGEEEKNEGDSGGEDEDEERGGTIRRTTTIGKTPINLASLSTSPPPSQTSSPSQNSNLQRASPRPSPNSRIRAQSTYGVPGSQGAATGGVTRLSLVDPGVVPRNSREANDDDGKGSWRTRSRSIDRFGLSSHASNTSLSSSSTTTFVDPLIIRKKEKSQSARNSIQVLPQSPVAVTAARGRVPFGDLLAFFDAEKAKE